MVKDSVQYRVASIHDLTNKIISHFVKYPLITQKQADFLFFKKVIELINNKALDGLNKIRKIKSCMNTGRIIDRIENNPSFKLGSPSTYFIKKIHKRSFNTNVRGMNRIGPHNNDVISVIIGSVMGKAQSNNPKISGEGVRICYRQSNIHKEYLSTSCKLPMDPYYITGFGLSDGEACFRISIYRNKDCKNGWWVNPTFNIELHKKDASILSQIKSFFGLGSLNIRKSNRQIIYTVASVKDLKEVLIPYFTQYLLVNTKCGDFILLKSAVELINQKKHLTIEGLQEIVSIRAAMNLGLTETLIESFPDITYKASCTTDANFATIPSPYCLTGFTEAEGCFFVSVHKSKSYNVGYQTQLSYSVVQHKRDAKLIEYFLSYFDCGNINIRSNQNSVSFSVTKGACGGCLFFKNIGLLCSKNKEFIDFCIVFFLVKSKSHLTEQGLNKIIEIPAGMNKGRNIKLNEDTNISPIKPVLPNKDSSTPIPISFSNYHCVQPCPIILIQKREFHHKVKARNRIGPHNVDTLSVIYGSLLGNGQIKRLVEGSMLVLRETNLDYVQWLYKFLYNRGYTSNLQPRQYTIKSHTKEGKIYYGYEFNTFTFRSFTWIHKMFYNKGKKSFNNLDSKYLTPLALAVFSMSNATYLNGCIELYMTKNLEEKDITKLCQILNYRFELDTPQGVIKKQVKNRFVIVISKESVKRFQTIVSPYFIPNLNYKIGLCNPSNFKTTKTLFTKTLPTGKRSYTTLNHLISNQLNPQYITGFSDAEANFTILFTKNKTFNEKHRYRAFQINIHKNDLKILHEIKSFFSVGEIYEHLYLHC